MTRVTRTPEEFKSITATQFDKTATKWTVTTTEGFDREAMSRHIGAAGVQRSKDVGKPDAAPWVANWTLK